MRYIKNLSFETQSLLKRIYKFSKNHEVRQRAKCILLSYNKFTINVLVNIFDVHLNTIYNWLDNWEKLSLLSLYNSKGQGRKPLLTADNEQFIKESIIENPKQLKRIVAKLDAEKGIKVSVYTIKRFLKKTEFQMETYS